LSSRTLLPLRVLQVRVRVLVPLLLVQLELVLTFLLAPVPLVPLVPLLLSLTHLPLALPLVAIRLSALQLLRALLVQRPRLLPLAVLSLLPRVLLVALLLVAYRQQASLLVVLRLPMPLSPTRPSLLSARRSLPPRTSRTPARSYYKCLCDEPSIYPDLLWRFVICLGISFFFLSPSSLPHFLPGSAPPFIYHGDPTMQQRPRLPKLARRPPQRRIRRSA
jgi:hypothetical protein